MFRKFRNSEKATGEKHTGSSTGKKRSSGSPGKKRSTRSQGVGSTVAVREFEVDGIRVVLTTKRVKNINLRVKPGGYVAVSAPPWVSETYIEGFVREKSAWIGARLQASAQRSRALVDDASPEQLAAWRAVVEAAVPPLIARWEPVMGVKSKKLAYRSMTSRWGSCNPQTGRICINVQLAEYPPECLEYVVVHELCHLLERGHGPRFKALMDAFLPDWRERRAKLRMG